MLARRRSFGYVVHRGERGFWTTVERITSLDQPLRKMACPSRRGRRPSLPRKARLPFLHIRRYRLLAIGGGRHDGVVRGDEVEAGAQVDALALIDRALDEADRELRAALDLGGDLADMADELFPDWQPHLRRETAGHEAPELSSLIDASWARGIGLG